MVHYYILQKKKLLGSRDTTLSELPPPLQLRSLVIYTELPPVKKNAFLLPFRFQSRVFYVKIQTFIIPYGSSKQPNLQQQVKKKKNHFSIKIVEPSVKRMALCSCFGPSKAERREADRIESQEARSRAAQAAQMR